MWRCSGERALQNDMEAHLVGLEQPPGGGSKPEPPKFPPCVLTSTGKPPDDRIDGSVRAAGMVLDDLKHASAAKTPE